LKVVLLKYGFEPDGGLQDAEEVTQEIVAKLRQVEVLTAQGKPVNRSLQRSDR
jgi:hypothetical protein